MGLLHEVHGQLEFAHQFQGLEVTDIHRTVFAVHVESARAVIEAANKPPVRHKHGRRHGKLPSLQHEPLDLIDHQDVRQGDGAGADRVGRATIGIGARHDVGNAFKTSLRDQVFFTRFKVIAGELQRIVANDILVTRGLFDHGVHNGHKVLQVGALLVCLLL